MKKEGGDFSLPFFWLFSQGLGIGGEGVANYGELATNKSASLNPFKSI
jgi:hypothetical protein